MLNILGELPLVLHRKWASKTLCLTLSFHLGWYKKANLKSNGLNCFATGFFLFNWNPPQNNKFFLDDRVQHFWTLFLSPKPVGSVFFRADKKTESQKWLDSNLFQKPAPSYQAGHTEVGGDSTWVHRFWGLFFSALKKNTVHRFLGLCFLSALKKKPSQQDLGTLFFFSSGKSIVHRFWRLCFFRLWKNNRVQKLVILRGFQFKKNHPV